MHQFDEKQIFTFYNDRLARIGVDEHMHSRHELTEVVMQRALRLGYGREIVNLWLLGRTRTRPA